MNRYIIRYEPSSKGYRFLEITAKNEKEALGRVSLYLNQPISSCGDEVDVFTAYNPTIVGTFNMEKYKQ